MPMILSCRPMLQTRFRVGRRPWEPAPRYHGGAPSPGRPPARQATPRGPRAGFGEASAGPKAPGQLGVILDLANSSGTPRNRVEMAGDGGPDALLQLDGWQGLHLGYLVAEPLAVVPGPGI